MNTRLCLVSITFAVTMLSPAAGRADYQRIAGYPIDLRGSGLVSAYIGDFDGDERLEIVGA